MKTYMANAQTVERKWYVVDAAGVPLGRLASKVAAILRGKNKPTFTPHVDTGDFVIVVNCDKAVLTGKKLDDKFYRYHTGYIGGLKETSYRKMMAEKSDRSGVRGGARNASEEFSWQKDAQKAQSVQGCGAQPRGTEARRTEIILTRWNHGKSKSEKETAVLGNGAGEKKRSPVFASFRAAPAALSSTIVRSRIISRRERCSTS